MTDNEKAATFIGWSPTPTNRGYCLAATVRSQSSCFIAEAPDMSKPQNYMRALEALPDNRWPDMCLHENRHWRCSIWSQWNNDIGSHAIYWGGDGETCGEAVVKALVALYDAEHPDV